MDAAYRDIFEAMYTRRFGRLFLVQEGQYPQAFAYPPGPDELLVQQAIDQADAGLFHRHNGSFGPMPSTFCY
jgi:hypothetical protein